MIEIRFSDNDAFIVFPRVHLVPKQEVVEIFKEIKALDKKPCDEGYKENNCTGCPLWSLVDKTSPQIPCTEIFKIIKSMEF